MKKSTLIVLGLVLAFAAGAGYYVWSGVRDIRKESGQQENPQNGQNATSTPQNGTPVNTTGLSLKLPAGFSAETVAKVKGARVMVFDSFGNIWVSQTDEGTITQLEMKDGKVSKQSVVFKNLRKPHGLAIDGSMLYIAEENKISRVTLYSDDTLHKIADLPTGGRHTTRTIAFGPDGKLYVSIGSTCDVCNEKDEKLASIYSMNKDGSGFKQVAKGLRNSVFFTWSYVDGKMYATEMGRDNLGDNVPPDEINVIDIGPGSSPGRPATPADFGWPTCYGNKVHDTNFDKNQYIRDPCADTTAPFVELPAHSAPLGIAMVPEEGWPEEYWYDLIVALHGSWNRSQPAGYKIVRVKMDAKGNYQGMEDFITGFLPANATSGNSASGRPVQIITQPGGIMYVTDDKAGAIYKIFKGAPSAPSDNQTPSTPVSVPNIKPNSIIKSPLVIEGEALGTWYFEASFPIQVVDAKGKVLGQAVAQAQGDWMTEKMVPFKATLTFTKPTAGEGMLIFKKDNPSGDPSRDQSFSIAVRFSNATSAKPTPTPSVQLAGAGCIVSGCSGEICSEENMNSLCVYKPEFACYKTARCEKQSNGKCGWTVTKELSTCLQSN